MKGTISSVLCRHSRSGSRLKPRRCSMACRPCHCARHLPMACRAQTPFLPWGRTYSPQTLCRWEPLLVTQPHVSGLPVWKPHAALAVLDHRDSSQRCQLCRHTCTVVCVAASASLSIARSYTTCMQRQQDAKALLCMQAMRWPRTESEAGALGGHDFTCEVLISPAIHLAHCPS